MGSKRSDDEIRPTGWPAWAKRLATLALLWHALAVLAGAFATEPASDLERAFASAFAPYHGAIDQGVSYRYYSSAFPPTPVVTATLTFADGRPETVVRLPERGLRPRLLYQRQLALAHGLMEDFQAARTNQHPYDEHHDHEGHEGHEGHSHGPTGLDGERPGDGSRSRWAHAFATHLCRSNPGCSNVTLRLQFHMVPLIGRVQEELNRPGKAPVDLDAEEFYTVPERIGDYPCDAS